MPFCIRLSALSVVMLLVFFYSNLLKTQLEALERKFRVDIRIVHRCPYVKVEDLFTVTKGEITQNLRSEVYKEKIGKLVQIRFK